MALGTTAPNCCCTIFSDGFYGAALRPLTWNVDSGTWTVASNVLSSSSASAQINLLPSAGAALNALKAPFLQQVSVYLATGCQYRFYCGGNYLELDCTTVGGNLFVTGTLRVNSVSVTVSSYSISNPGYYTVAICWNVGSVVAEIFYNSLGSEPVFVLMTNEGLGSSATWGPGLGTGPGNTGTCKFYGLLGVGLSPVVGFVLARTGITGYNVSGIPITCPGCPACAFCSGATPAEWEAVVTGATGAEAALNGTYILVGGPDNGSPGQCYWQYAFPDGTGYAQLYLQGPPANVTGQLYFDIGDPGIGAGSLLLDLTVTTPINCLNAITQPLAASGSVTLTPITT